MYVNVTLELPEKDCCDLLTTAWEGGSDYWTPAYDAKGIRRGGPEDPELRHLDVVRIEYQTPDGDDEFNEPVKQPVVNAAAMAAAIAKVLNGEVEVGQHIKDDINHNIREVGACDADTADVLLQIATFGEIIYG